MTHEMLKGILLGVTFCLLVLSYGWDLDEKSRAEEARIIEQVPETHTIIARWEEVGPDGSVLESRLYRAYNGAWTFYELFQSESLVPGQHPDLSPTRSTFRLEEGDALFADKMLISTTIREYVD